ncbi:MAG: diguanylate cyclase [bacterium]
MTAVNPIRVLLVDDNPEVHFHFDEILAGRPEFELTCAKSLTRARRIARAGEVDVLVVDKRVTGVHDAQLIEFGARFPYIPTITLSQSQECTESWITLTHGELQPDRVATKIIAAVRQAEVRKRQHDAWSFLTAIVDSLRDRVAVLSSDKEVFLANEAWRIAYGLGTTASEWLGAMETEVEGRVVLEELDQLFNASRAFVEHDVQLGTSMVHVQMAAFYHEKRRFVVVSENDMTREQGLANALNDLQFRDRLTGLPNRDAFVEILDATLESELPSCVLFISLDHFRDVNRTYGYVFGDEVLAHLTARMSEVLTPMTFLARLAGVEFVAVVRGAFNPTMGEEVAEALSHAITDTKEVNGNPVRVSASIGLAFPHSGDNTADALRAAEVAMHAAKRQGGGWYSFDGATRLSQVRRVNARTELIRAITNSQLLLHFQPVACLKTRKTCALEVQLKWSHPDRGLLDASVVVDAAVRAGLIPELTTWFVEQLETDAPSVLACYSDVQQIIVRASRYQVIDPAFVSVFPASIEDRAVSISLDADAVAAQDRRLDDVLSQAHARGIAIWLHDVTGLLDLQRLAQLGVAGMSVHHSVISDSRMSAGLSALANAMALETTATNVESDESADTLASQGWSRAQGRVFGHACGVDDILTQNQAELDEASSNY